VQPDEGGVKLPSWYLIHTGYSVTRHKNHKNGELQKEDRILSSFISQISLVGFEM
jgi:hypothetical protein